MKVQVLASAALSALVGAAAAQSNVTVFGVIDANAYRKQLAGESAVYKVDSGGMTTSHFGLRGTEDLGGGLSASFTISSFFRADVGGAGRSDTDPFWARAAWVGLGHTSYGTVRFGRQTTENMLNLMRFSPFFDSAGFGPSLLHNFMPAATSPMMTGSGSSGTGDSSWTNALSLTTPNLGGAVGTLMFAPSEGTTAGRRSAGSIYYTRGALAATVVVEQIEKMSLNFSKPPAVVLVTDSKVLNTGVSYDLGAAKLFGQYIRTRLNNATVDITLATTQLGVSAPLVAGRVLAAWAGTKKTQTSAAGQKRDTLSIGYDHDLSKRTDLYAVLMNDKVTGLSTGMGYAVGIRHRF